MIGLTEMLRARGYNPDPKKVKLVRHRDTQYDVEKLLRDGWLDVYQMYQEGPVFDRCEQIISFIGEDSGATRFWGVFDVLEQKDAADVPLSQNCPFPELSSPGRFYYSLKRREGLDDLTGRLIIEWGKGARAWHQWLKNDRQVVEIRPKGRVLPPFRDYLRVNLSHDDLQRLWQSADAHTDWITGLSAVGAIYLIVDRTTGQQYVGSATGTGGLWQRWAEYAQTGHGGNSKLHELCQQANCYPAAFQFSILETFSRSVAKQEAIELEQFFKAKLGSRAFGLNAN